MSLRQYWRDVKHRFNHFLFEEFPTEGFEAAEKYAKDAYACCVAWYGLPLDPQKPYFLQQVKGSSSCTEMLGRYYLAISKEATTPEKLCSKIAHEMYHRVTEGRKGLAGEMWVQEMMAILSSHWFLRQQGFKEYAEAIKKQWLEMPSRANVSLVRASRRRTLRDWLLRGGDWYSPEFTDSIGRISYALLQAIDAREILPIVKVKTLEEWINALPENDQYSVCRVLEVPVDRRVVPNSTKELGRLLQALKAKGDMEALVAEFEQFARSQPKNGAAFFFLGRAYEEAKLLDAALDAYHKAADLHFSDHRLPYNIGNVHWHKQDFMSAARWYQEAADCAPTSGVTYYFLGRSHKNLGNISAARQAWEQVLTLDDEHYVKLARKALEENPMPMDAAAE